MPNEVPSSPPQNTDIPINGGSEIRETEAENEQSHTHKKYVLDDFSQQRINHGQQTINYLIAEVNEKIVQALTQLSIAIGVGSGNANSEPVKEAIKQVSEANKRIAGEFPPGCGDPK